MNVIKILILIFSVLYILPYDNMASENAILDLRENGSVPVWLVAGMLPNREKGIHHDDMCIGFYKDYLKEIGGETNAVPAEGDVIESSQGSIDWKISFADPSGILDFNKIFDLKKPKSVVAYAFCQLHSTENQPVRFKIRSDDGIRVWLNQKFIHESHEPRGIDEAEDIIEINLKKGDNRLLLKVDQGMGGWGLGFQVEILRESQQAILSERIKLKDVLIPRLSDLSFRIIKPSIYVDGKNVFPVEMQMLNTGVSGFSVQISNSGWDSERIFRFENPIIGHINDEILLEIPAGKIKGQLHVTVRQSGMNQPIYQSVIEPYPYSELFKSSPELFVIQSSHQDIAWMESPQQCIEHRDELIITPALELLRTDPGYHYDIEDALIIKEYLQRHPERKEEINQYCREGRLMIGATFTQPYESLNSGEALARQLYFGRRWLKKELPGCNSRIASSPDVPGRAIQMPQLLHKAGVDYILLSRFRKGFFQWNSPNGSGVVAYSMGHYGNDWQFILNNIHNLSNYLVDQQDFLNKWQPFYREHNLDPVLPVLASYDMSSPSDISPLQKQFTDLSGKLYTKKGIIDHQFHVPRYATTQKMLDRLMQTQPKLPVISGERPNVWLYIHGPTHHKAISAAREAAVLLPAAETFNTMYALLKNDMSLYPQSALNDSWEALVYPDHGWGGKNGEITDYVFLSKFEEARLAGKNTLHMALEGIAGMIKLPENGKQAFVVFNSLSRPRTEIVNTELNFASGQVKQFRLQNFDKKEVPFQVVSESLYDDGSISKVQISFLAENVPSTGYQTYFVIPGTGKSIGNSLPGEPLQFENSYYKITFSSGGVTQIYDKQLKCNILNTDKFLGGEIFLMTSVGNGAGEFSEVQQPTMDYFDKVSSYDTQWQIKAMGKISVTYQLELAMEQATIVQKVTIYNNKKQIDFTTDILGWDGTKNLEFRQAFPVDMKNGQIAYEVPFGQVRVGIDELEGAAGERYVQDCSDVHPREVQNWMSCSDDKMKVTLSSSVAVMDWIDPTDDPVDYPVLQPVLLASRRSCHGEGNWYLQEGDHSFHFSLFSGNSTENTEQLAVGRNHPLQTIQIMDTDKSEAHLPLVKSFVRCDNEDIAISTIKKCEDDGTIILRCYEKGMSQSKATIGFFKEFNEAARTNLIEENSESLSDQGSELKIKLMPWSIETYKLNFE